MSVDYQTFLDSKRIVAPTTGIDVPIEAINPKLFPFQRVLTQWCLRKGRAAAFLDTGLGKTILQCEWARLIGGRALIVAPLTVARQTVGIARNLLSLEVHYTRSGQDLVDGLNVTNYEMVDKFEPGDFQAIVLDECFAPGTLIDTPTGKRPIESIRPGDAVLNAAGIDRVWDVHCREVPYAIRITVGGQSVVSSPNHPYFTQRGWVAAQDLQPGDSLVSTTQAMRMVREGISEEIVPATKRIEVLRSILFSEMAHEATGTPGESSCTRGGSKARATETRMVRVGQSESRSGTRAHSEYESYVATRSAGEDLPHVEVNPPQTFRAWGQRAWLDAAAGDTTGCAWRRLGSGIFFITGQANSRLSHELQDRLGKSRAQNCHRGGWVLSSFTEGAGCQEGCKTGFARVDRLEVLESRHSDLERLRDADDKLCFYDLSASRHPSFSVGGFLVHNSSILKSIDGKTKAKLIAMFADTPFRLCCTATPAPNDIAEIGNHAEFLGVMNRTDMLATFFVHDESGWRLKKHAQEHFFRWLASWGMSIRRPSDIGFDDTGYILPPLHIEPIWVETDYKPRGMLFNVGLKGIQDRTKVRQSTLQDRVRVAVDFVNSDNDQWIVWAGLNDEADQLHAAIPGSVNVEGAQSPDAKAAAIEAFQDGKYRVLVTKAKVAGFGMNFQNCHKMAFVGLSDSWEAYYQCIRRCWRFGQVNPVQVYIILSEAEQAIYENVKRKEVEAQQMAERLIANVREFERAEIGQVGQRADYRPQLRIAIPEWIKPGVMASCQAGGVE